MNEYFADSFYFLALLNSRDTYHVQAVTFSARTDQRIVTTTWVLTEVADAMATPPNRKVFIKFHQALLASPRVRVIPPTRELYDRALLLYGARADKSWSLTDCVSFTVMRQEAVKEALSGDRHFEQAGFVRLFK